MTKIIIISNPNAGNEQGIDKGEALKEMLEQQGNEVILRITAKRGDAKQFAQEACDDKADAVYIMGGDGTISEAMNGLGANTYRPQVAFIPLGTVNNLARMLGLSLSDEEALTQYESTTTFEMDLGQINEEYFISTVTAGTLPQAFAGVDNEEKTQLGMFAFVLGGLKAINQEETSRFELALDNLKYQDDYEMLIIGLGNSVAAINNFFTEARLDDGRLNLFALKKISAFEKVGTLLDVLQNNHSEENEHVDYYQFKRGQFKIETMAATLNETTVDGDKGPGFPLEIKVLPKHLTVIIPKGSTYDSDDVDA